MALALPAPVRILVGSMIRRTVGNEFWLVSQHEHALLSGQLARCVGNTRFAAASPRAVLGIELHDCGWPLHDDAPTLNEQGLPLDVFECPRALALEVWQAAVDRALERDDYAALLVSLHVLSLSTTVTSTSSTAPASATPPPARARGEHNPAKARFELNRFQHKQIEIIEALRRKLRLPVDVPLRLGLAESLEDAGECELHFDFRLLQAMDRLSLAICCSHPPAGDIRPVLSRPGGATLTLRARRVDEVDLRVDPWPFGAEELAVSVPFRRVPNRRFTSATELRETYHAAPNETLAFRLTTT